MKESGRYCQSSFTLMLCREGAWKLLLLRDQDTQSEEVEPASSQRPPVSSPSICKRLGLRLRLAGAVDTMVALLALAPWAVWAREVLSLNPCGPPEIAFPGSLCSIWVSRETRAGPSCPHSDRVGLSHASVHRLGDRQNG